VPAMPVLDDLLPLLTSLAVLGIAALRANRRR
jgi:hypothetical protein